MWLVAGVLAAAAPLVGAVREPEGQAKQQQSAVPDVTPKVPAGQSLPTAGLPAGWRITTKGYSGRLVEGAKAGAVAIEFSRDLAKPEEKGGKAKAEAGGGADEGDGTGVVLISVPGGALAGKKVQLAAEVRVNEAATRGQLWLRADRKGGQAGFFDNMNDRPVRPGGWKKVGITGAIDADTEWVTLGVVLTGGAGATVQVSGLRLQPVGQEGDGNVPPRMMSKVGRANVAAAGKLVSLLRYFHADSRSRGMDASDWDAVMIAAVERAEPAESAAALAEVLRGIAAELGSGVSVVEGNAPVVGGVEATRPEWATHNAGWQHYGVGMGMQGNIYWSRRVVEHRSTPAERSKLAKVEKGAEKGEAVPVHRAELGRGLVAIVPLVVWCDSSGSTLGPGVKEAPGRMLVPARPEYWMPSDGDRSTRVAGVLHAWNTLEMFYPYFGDRPLDWNAALGPAMEGAATAKDWLEYLAVLRRLVARLEDGHGYVTGPRREVDTLLPLPLRWAEGKVVISQKVAMRPESLRAGDVLVAIEGKRVDELVARYRKETSGATKGHIDEVVLSRLVQMPTPKRATLTVKRGDAEMEVRITRIGPGPGDAGGDEEREAAGPTVMPEAIARPESGKEIADGVMYLNLVGLKVQQLGPLLEQLAAAKGVVVDVRGYPDSAGVELLNHLVRRPMRSLNMEVPLRTRPGSSTSAAAVPGNELSKVSQWELRPKTPRIRGKVVFLTDASAISYAESCMSVVESLKLGEIVGQTTAGTNGNINQLTLPGGYTVIFTGMRVTKDDGSVYHGVGVTPQHVVEPTIAGIKAGRDEQLDKAVELATPKP